MTMRPLLAILILGSALPSMGEIKRIDLIHLQHADVGFTDHPSVAREMYKKYLDIALDTCLARKDFYWTAESLLPVMDWWREAAPARRRQFLEVVRRGQIAVGALPFNNTPFMDAAQWRQMLSWIPADLWRQLNPRVALQDDVNGMPRAGVVQLLDRGIQRLWMGLNGDSGGPPFSRPAAFWWRMPDGRRMFVYIGDSYAAGYGYFHDGSWRRGPVPRVADTAFRPPERGEILAADEKTVREAHEICVRRMKALEARGYSLSTVVISFTNEWRMDNDPPFPPLADFVATWNRLGLKPELRFTTAAGALADVEKEDGGALPEYSGEWTDWWANGTASGPREVAASRFAKRSLRALDSPVWGAPDSKTTRMAVDLRKDLCLFDEHTWGSSLSVALPDSLDTIGQYNEKSRLAYRPMALAEWLVSERARVLYAKSGPGMYAINSAPLPYTGWVTVPVPAMRRAYGEPDHYESGMEPWKFPKSPADLSPWNEAAVFADTVPKMTAKYWVDALPANSARPLKNAESKPSAPKVETDAHGWPVSIVWPGMSKPLFLAGFGDFLSVRPVGFAPRVILNEMAHGKPGKIEETAGVEVRAVRTETSHTILYTQDFTHSSLKRATRQLEIWKGEPRARLTVRIDRRSSPAPESFYVAFPLPVEGAAPSLSSGGMPFTPYRGQLPGSCRDYFAIDGWADWATPAGHWLWVSRDAPLVTFDRPEVWVRRTAPADTHRILAMVFNNFWYTNFVANENGVMEFEFDLAWKPSIPDPDALALTLISEPLVVLK